MPILVVIQKPHYLAKLVRASLNYAMLNYGYRLWLEKLMQTQFSQSQQTITIDQLSFLVQ